MSTNLQNKSRTNPNAQAALEVGAALRQFRVQQGLTSDVMAGRLQISRGYLSEIENGKSEPSDKILRVLEREFSVNLLTLKGKQVSISPAPGYLKPQNHVAQPSKPWPQDYAEGNAQPYGIPLFDLGVSAGAGHGMQPGLQPQDAAIEVYFTPAYMRRHFGRSGNGFAMVYVKGDSMQPTLWDGDEIVVDTRVQRVDRDGIYVFMLRGDIKVKRMQVKLDGSLLVKSDNAAYETEQVGAGQADTFQVQGRLVWPRLR